MKKNVGSTDKMIRLILAVLFIIAGILLIQSILWLSIIFFVLALTMTITSLTNRCPLYVPFGIRTNKNEDRPQP